MIRRLVVWSWLVFFAPMMAQAFELAPQRVAEHVYALVGLTGARTYDNHGLNDNFGFIVTEEGVALIDSGASRQGAQVIEVPVMLLVVNVVNRSRGWYERRAGFVPHEQCCPVDLHLHAESKVK